MRSWCTFFPNVPKCRNWHPSPRSLGEDIWVPYHPWCPGPMPGEEGYYLFSSPPFFLPAPPYPLLLSIFLSRAKNTGELLLYTRTSCVSLKTNICHHSHSSFAQAKLGRDPRSGKPSNFGGENPPTPQPSQRRFRWINAMSSKSRGVWIYYFHPNVYAEPCHNMSSG